MTTWLSDGNYNLIRPSYLSVNNKRRIQILGLSGGDTATLSEVYTHEVVHQVVNPFGFEGTKRPLPFSDFSTANVKNYVYEPYSGKVFEYSYIDGDFVKRSRCRGPSINANMGILGTYVVHQLFNEFNGSLVVFVPDTRPREYRPTGPRSYDIWQYSIQNDEWRLNYRPVGGPGAPIVSSHHNVVKIDSTTIALCRLTTVRGITNLRINPFSIARNRWLPEALIDLTDHVVSTNKTSMLSACYPVYGSRNVSLFLSGVSAQTKGSYHGMVVAAIGTEPFKLCIHAPQHVDKLRDVFYNPTNGSLIGLGSGRTPSMNFSLGVIDSLWDDTRIGVYGLEHPHTFDWHARRIILKLIEQHSKKTFKKKYKSLYAHLMHHKGVVGPGREVEAYDVKFSALAMASLKKAFSTVPPSREVTIRVKYNADVVTLKVPNGPAGSKIFIIDTAVWNKVFIDKMNISSVINVAPALGLFMGASIKKNSEK